jgi:hypothetical protein
MVVFIERYLSDLPDRARLGFIPGKLEIISGNKTDCKMVLL